MYKIQLGMNAQERTVIISAIKHMGRAQFEQVLKDLHQTHRDSASPAILSLEQLSPTDSIIRVVNPVE